MHGRIDEFCQPQIEEKTKQRTVNLMQEFTH